MLPESFQFNSVLITFEKWMLSPGSDLYVHLCDIWAHEYTTSLYLFLLHTIEISLELYAAMSFLNKSKEGNSNCKQTILIALQVLVKRCLHVQTLLTISKD